MSKGSSIKRLKDGRIECVVSFPEEDVKTAEAKALQELAAHVKVDGFREGKAPPEIIRDRIDNERLFERTIHNLLPEAFESLVKEHELKPIVRPRVEAQSRDPLTVKITFIEKPKVTVKGAGKIRIDRKQSLVDEKDVEKMVNYVTERHKKTIPVDRASREGDEVTMDFWGEMDGKEVEGTRTKGHKVEIGSHTLIPGFEDNLKDLRKGETRSFTVTFPEKYHAENLQGKPVTFHVTINDVAEVSRPELNDAFAKENLDVESMDAFRSRVRASMATEEETLERQRRERALLDAVAAATDVELAPELVDEETRGMVEEFAQQISRQNVTIDQYLKQTNTTPEKFLADMKEQATKRLKLRLGIEHLVMEEKTEIADKDIEQAVEELIARTPEAERAKAKEMYQKGSMGYAEMLWQKKVERLIEKMLAA